MIHLITGGARSGKSHYAKQLAHDFSSVTFVATAIAFDNSMKHRIEHHQRNRPSEWITLEQWQGFTEPFETECVIVDCLTLMMTNLLLNHDREVDTLHPEELDVIEQSIMREIENLIAAAENRELILVTNEIGMGLSPPTVLGNIFRDIAGRMNQLVAQRSDRVVLMVSGIPLIIK